MRRCIDRWCLKTRRWRLKMRRWRLKMRRWRLKIRRWRLKVGAGDSKWGAGNSKWGAGDSKWGAGDLKWGTGDSKWGAGDSKCVLRLHSAPHGDLPRLPPVFTTMNRSTVIFYLQYPNPRSQSVVANIWFFPGFDLAWIPYLIYRNQYLDY